MRQMMILAAVVILAAGMAGAADKTNIVLRSGESVTNASITRVEPDGITLMYGPHIRKCAFTELSDDVQQQFGYNPTNAAAYADKTARKLQANARRDAEARQAQADEAAEKERAAKAAAVEAKKSPADKRAEQETAIRAQMHADDVEAYQEGRADHIPKRGPAVGYGGGF